MTDSQEQRLKEQWDSARQIVRLNHHAMALLVGTALALSVYLVVSLGSIAPLFILPPVLGVVYGWRLFLDTANPYTYSGNPNGRPVRAERITRRQYEQYRDARIARDVAEWNR